MTGRYFQQAAAAAVWVETEAHRMMDDMAEHGFKATRVQDSILFDFDPAGARAQMGLTPPRSQHMGYPEHYPLRYRGSATGRLVMHHPAFHELPKRR